MVFLDVFVRKEYKNPYSDDIDLILDLGANVGYSAIYFAKHYPNATIVALEPEETNFKLLCRNTKQYPNVISLNIGVWWRQAKIDVINPNADSWGYRFKETESRGIECVTIQELIEKYGSRRGVMIKMDVEGAEEEIFEKNPKWLSIVKLIQVEIHGCWKAVFDALSQYPYKASISGENIVIDLSKGRQDAKVKL